MTDHIRPPHPGCQQCTNFQIGITRVTGDLGHARRTLVRAQNPGWPYPEQIPGLVDEANTLKARRVETIEIYHQHYASAHPSFADSAAPFAKAPSHRLTADDISEITNLLRDGLPYEEIAEAFGVSRGTVQYHASKAGLTVTDRKAEARGEELDQHGLRVEDQPWAVDALCAQTDPEAFFPDKGGSTREAKAVCATCTVAAECLDYALANGERFGIWGGLSERERRKLIKAMKATPQEEPTPPTEGTAA